MNQKNKTIFVLVNLQLNLFFMNTISKKFFLASLTVVLFMVVQLTATAQQNRDHESEHKHNQTNALENLELRVLVFSGTGWYRHPEIPAINGWLVRTGAIEGMQLDVTETAVDVSAESLANYHIFYKDANLINTEIDRYLAVTKADIQRVAKEYFKKDSRVNLFYLPKQAQP